MVRSGLWAGCGVSRGWANGVLFAATGIGDGVSYPAVLAALDPGDHVRFNDDAPTAIETPELVVESVTGDEDDPEVMCRSASGGYPTHVVRMDDPEIGLYEVTRDGERRIDDVVTISLVAVE